MQNSCQHRARQQRAERGIVTIEFAFGILASVIVMIMLAWGIFLFGAKIAAIDAAGSVARQLARGDTASAVEAERNGPANAHYVIRSSAGVVRVTAVVDAHPLDAMPTFRLSASAEAALEPGQAGPR